MAEKYKPKRSPQKNSRIQDIFFSLFSFRRDGSSRIGRAIMPTYEDRLEEKEGSPLEKLARQGITEPIPRKTRSEDVVNHLLTLLKGVADSAEHDVDVNEYVQKYLRQILQENTPEEKINKYLAFFNDCSTNYQAVRSAQRLVAARCHPEFKNQFAPWVYRVALKTGFNDKTKIFSAEVLKQIDVSASESRSALFAVQKELEQIQENKNE